jgi:hypothetical protein
MEMCVLLMVLSLADVTFVVDALIVEKIEKKEMRQGVNIRFAPKK